MSPALSVGLSICLFLFGLTPPAAADLLVKNGQSIDFMGDSITDMGWNTPGGYVKLVTSGLAAMGVKITPIPAGVGGQTSRDMLARVKSDIIDRKPDWLTLSCGVNDVWHGAGGVGLDEFKKNITSIVDQAQAAGIKVVIMTATVIGEDLPNDNNTKLAAYNDFLRQLAKDRNLPLADENAAFQAALKAPPPVPSLTLDGVHPDPAGQELMAKTLLTAFGATSDQIDKAEQAWLDGPATADISANFFLPTSETLTLQQYDAIGAAAAQHKVRTGDFIHELFFAAVAETFKAYASNPNPPGMGTFKDQVQKAFEEKIDALTKPQ